MDVDAEIAKLHGSRLLRNTEEVAAFESALENIVSLKKDPRCIKDLCAGFDDDAEESEVMFGLVHAIEEFEGEDGLLHMANSIPAMLPHAKEWATILHYRILNHEPSRNAYINVLNTTDDAVKAVIVRILLEIKHEDRARFESSVNEILTSLTL